MNFKMTKYLQTARSICDFILHDLPRTVDTDTRDLLQLRAQTQHAHLQRQSAGG